MTTRENIVCILFELKRGEFWLLKILFAAPADRDSRFLILDWWRSFLCRWKGHPNGIIYYNPYGWEPDDRCKDCGDRCG